MSMYFIILLSFVVLYDYFLCVNTCTCHVYFKISLLTYFVEVIYPVKNFICIWSVAFWSTNS